MKFELSTNLRGIKVQGEGLEYTFLSKLFSHSSTLIDEHSDVIASLNRASWWRMDFDLSVNGMHYQLSQRLSETTLTLKDSEINFVTKSGLAFFNQSKPVTEIQHNDLRANKFSLKINQKEHWRALLVASCLECYSARVNG